MRFQPKRFVVEVKRGTSRAAFTSADMAPSRFSEAEELLFKGPKASPKIAVAEAPGPAGGRILRSLIEPPPEVPDLPEPARRGRKPGSKNKPKPAPAQAATERPAEAEWDMEPAPARAAAEALCDIAAAPPPNAPAPAAAALAPRIRLRHRSSIIKRYVLELDPCPGQAGSLRARRAARLPR